MTPTPSGFTDFVDAEVLFTGRRSRIYRARRRHDGRAVVLKALPEDYPSPSEAARLAREFRITDSVDHPHVIGVLELARLPETMAIVLEDIGADSLATVLAHDGVSLAQALSIGRRLADALDALHAAEIVHKDINPSNVVWRRDTDELRLIDFGIALTLSREKPASVRPKSVEGTLAYMSPEQTGRTNRVLDYRTDLYSLGVTLYELICSRRPFEGDDPLELMHSHMALVPTAPHEIDPSVPVVVSDIVMRLLSKDAEDRYQSARGLERDLARCLEEMDESGRMASFPLGEHDVVSTLRVPDKLYGRRMDIDRLEAAFERAALGAMRVTVVTGAPGIGKTALVGALQRRVGHRRGSFAFGKFGQFDRDRPLQAVLSALRQRIRQILAEPESRLVVWRARLTEAMGGLGRAAVEVIAELGHLVGPQPPLPAVPAAEAEHRFHTAIQRVVQGLSSPSSPLVLVLDDLQWADAASLRLVEQLATALEARHLLILGAYRDTEVPASHPTALCFEAIRRHGVDVEEHHLGRLSSLHVRELLADALRLPADPTTALSALATLCLEKTGGNPFFLRQFLRGLSSDGLITWDDDAGRFVWDEAAIDRAAITDNVVAFLARRVGELDPDARDLLRYGAAIGATFDLETVAAVAAERDFDAASSTCVRLGMVIPLGHVDGMAERFAFTHDRVQNAGYELTPPADRAKLHLRLGRHTEPRIDEGDDVLFEVVDHLNRAMPLIDAGDERQRLLELNLEAGKRALRSAAPKEALDFFRFALSVRSPDAWDKRYEQSLELHDLAAEAAVLAGEAASLDAFAKEVERHARNRLHALRVKELEVAQLKSDRDLVGAVDASVALLEELGVNLGRSHHDVMVLKELVQTKLALRGSSMAELEQLPRTHNPEHAAAMRILGTMIPAAYYARPALLPFITFKIVRMSVRHGVCPTSAYGFVVYALLLCTLGQIDDGYDVGKMAVRLAERLGDPQLTNLARHVFSTHVRFWREPLARCAEVEREVHRFGVEIGDYEYAAFGAMMHCNMVVFTGEPLDEVLQTHEVYGAALARLQQETSVHQHAATHQLVLNLMGAGEGEARLRGPVYDEAKMVPKLKGDATMLFIHHAASVLLATFFGDTEAGIEHTKALGKYAKAAASSIWTFVAEHFAALAELRAMADMGAAQRAATFLRVKRRRSRLAGWARACPENLAHRVALVDAEIARVRGRHGDAMHAYGRAFEMAAARGLPGDEALACELAARFYASIGQSVAARAHLARARFAYGRWGAAAKVANLDRELSRGDVDATSVSSTLVTQSAHTTLTASGAQIDLTAVVRAAQAISETIVLDELLERLMQTLVEAAGASRGVLVLVSDGQPLVEAVATGHGEVAVGPSQPLESFEAASEQVIRYVLRMNEPLVVADAREPGDFRRDPYFAQGGVRSVLCAPIVGQGRPVAAVYLENNLAANAFTPNRTEVVIMLAGQAAISIENARLYAELDKKVKQRTAELELRNRFIRDTFGRYLSDNVVDSLLQSPEGLAMGGETRVVTVLMADLRGFIAKTRGLPPDRVVQLVNVFLSAMTEIIMRHGGTIDEFIGDAILAIFGAPVLGEDDASRAVRCALAMQREMEAVNEANRSLGLPDVQMGIGLSTGEVVVGNIGSERRAKYGVVGATVNLASRIESFTRGGDILLPESTRASLEFDIVADREFEVTTKGERAPIRLYRVVGIEGEAEATLSRQPAPLVVLETPLPIRYSRIDENHVRSTMSPGRVIALSREMAVIASSSAEPALTDLRIVLGDDTSPEIYAKVELPEPEADGTTFSAHFTAVPHEALELLARIAEGTDA